MQKMNKIIKYLAYKFLSPVKYARFVGVKLGANPIINTKYFGSEPYLIEIGDNIRTSINVYFLNHDGAVHVLRNLYKEFEQADLFRKIIIGNNVYIGINVTILSGTKVGDDVIIGAGSLVRGELKSNSVYAGVPVKYICSIDDFKEKNSHLFINTLSTEQVKKEKIIREMFNL